MKPLPATSWLQLTDRDHRHHRGVTQPRKWSRTALKRSQEISRTPLAAASTRRPRSQPPPRRDSITQLWSRTAATRSQEIQSDLRCYFYSRPRSQPPPRCDSIAQGLVANSARPVSGDLQSGLRRLRPAAGVGNIQAQHLRIPERGSFPGRSAAGQDRPPSGERAISAVFPGPSVAFGRLAVACGWGWRIGGWVRL